MTQGDTPSAKECPPASLETQSYRRTNWASPPQHTGTFLHRTILICCAFGGASPWRTNRRVLFTSVPATPPINHNFYAVHYICPLNAPFCHTLLQKNRKKFCGFSDFVSVFNFKSFHCTSEVVFRLIVFIN